MRPCQSNQPTAVGFPGIQPWNARGLSVPTLIYCYRCPFHQDFRIIEPNNSSTFEWFTFFKKSFSVSKHHFLFPESWLKRSESCTPMCCLKPDYSSHTITTVLISQQQEYHSRNFTKPACLSTPIPIKWFMSGPPCNKGNNSIIKWCLYDWEFDLIPVLIYLFILVDINVVKGLRSLY